MSFPSGRVFAPFPEVPFRHPHLRNAPSRSLLADADAGTDSFLRFTGRRIVPAARRSPLPERKRAYLSE